MLISRVCTHPGPLLQQQQLAESMLTFQTRSDIELQITLVAPLEWTPAIVTPDPVLSQKPFHRATGLSFNSVVHCCHLLTDIRFKHH